MAGDFKPIALSNEPYANSAPCSELMCVLYCVRNLALANRVLGYSMVLTPIRVSLFILADTSYNERRVAEYNRIHTASRTNLEVSKVRDLFAIKNYGTKPSQVNILPKAKSKTRSKQNKDMHKCSSVYSKRGVPLPVLTSGGE
jgi:hypothetical protein